MASEIKLLIARRFIHARLVPIIHELLLNYLLGGVKWQFSELQPRRPAIDWRDLIRCGIEVSHVKMLLSVGSLRQFDIDRSSSGRGLDLEAFFHLESPVDPTRFTVDMHRTCIKGVFQPNKINVVEFFF